MNKLNQNAICNVLVAVLIIALLVFQFIPGFWTYTVIDENGEFVEEQNPSLQGLIWWPLENEDLLHDSENGLDMEPEWERYIDEHGRNLRRQVHPINDVVLMPVVSLAFGALTVVFCVIKTKKFWASLFAFIVGLVGVIGYMTVPAFQMNSIWVVHLALCVAIAVISGFSLGITLADFIAKAKREGLI